LFLITQNLNGGYFFKDSAFGEKTKTMNVELTLGQWARSDWVFVIQVNEKDGLHIGGGLQFQFTRDILNKVLEKVHGAKVVDMKLFRILESFWIVPLSCHAELCSLLKRAKVVVSPIPQELFAALRTRSTMLDMTTLESLECYKKLYNYQKEGVSFIYQHGGRGIIGDEMGLGKTYQAATLIRFYDVSTLVVCPASLKVNWKEEFAELCNDDLHVLNSCKDDFKRKNVMSYGLLTSKKMASKLTHFEMLVLDESHYVKNMASKRTKLIIKLAKKAKYVILLSGTPSSRSSELFSQLKMVSAEHFKTFFPWQGRQNPGVFYFASRYCKPEKVFIGRNKFNYRFNGSERSWELYALLSHYMIRRNKELVLTELPPLLRQKITLENLSVTKQKFFDKSLKDIERVREKQGARSAEIQLMQLVNATAVIKVKHVLAYLKHVLEIKTDENKFLIFAHHHLILDAISEMLTEVNIKHICFDGRTKSECRQVLVKDFQTDESIKFAVLGINAAGIGLNLYKANIVIFAELIWSQEAMLQCEARAHRIGQENTVTIKYLLLGGSTDDLIWMSLNSKVKNTAAVLDNKRKYLHAEKDTYDEKKTKTEA
jgi:SWI/SNF-related matrix-associated actin-dependent regulator 1 of chromatin subfamily A